MAQRFGPSTPARSNPHAWTVEKSAFALILLLGAALRLANLSAQPLAPLEAGASWSAWRVAGGLHDLSHASSGSALLFTLQTLLFWLAGAGDGLARLAPALAGSVTVGLPWLLRQTLGKRAALILAALMAVDPWLVQFSRLADGTALTVFLGLLTLICLLRLYDADANVSVRWQSLVGGSVACGLLLVSGPLAWSFLILIGIYILFAGPPSIHALFAVDEGRTPQKLLAYGCGAALLMATAWFSRLSGLGTVGASLGEWLSRWFSAADPAYPLSWVLLRVVADQSFAILLGIPGLWLLLQGRRGTKQWTFSPRWPLFLLTWLLFALVTLLAAGRHPAQLALLHLPLLFGATAVIDWLVQRFPRHAEWRNAGLLLALMVMLWISASILGRNVVNGISLNLGLALSTLLLLLTAVMLWVIYLIWVGKQQGRWLGVAMVAVLMFTTVLGSMWQLNHVNDVSHPNGFLAVTTHPDTRLLTADIATLSAQRIGDAGEIELQVQALAAPDPVLGWYLRDMRRLKWVLAPETQSRTDDPPLFMTWLAESRISTAGYFGSQYDIVMTWRPTDVMMAVPSTDDSPEPAEILSRLELQLNPLWQSRVQPILRWILFRVVPDRQDAQPVKTPIILWVPQEGG